MDAGTQTPPPQQTQTVVEAPPPRPPPPDQVSLELSLLGFVVGLVIFCTYLLRLIRPTLKSDVVGTLLAGIPTMAAMLFLTGGAWVLSLMYAVPALGITAFLFDVLDRRTAVPTEPAVKPVQKE